MSCSFAINRTTVFLFVSVPLTPKKRPSPSAHSRCLEFAPRSQSFAFVTLSQYAQFVRYPDSLCSVRTQIRRTHKKCVLTLIPQNKNGLNKSSSVFIQRGWDSNPRWACAHTTLPRSHHQPLGHPSLIVHLSYHKKM